ncbi:MAG TPA: hypothetical protein VJ724_01360 [Tahibacter sp.]|nr:hypothetical protein [Tahibacter sp.]
MSVVVVPATAEHAAAVAAQAREADIAELWAVAHVTPAEAIRQGLALSGDARAALFDGVPACVFGVSTIAEFPGRAVPWMVGTAALERHQSAFLRRCRPVVLDWASRYDLLVNWVDARNLTAIRWLQWLGFVIGDPMPYGVDGLSFRPFEMRR